MHSFDLPQLPLPVVSTETQPRCKINITVPYVGTTLDVNAHKRKADLDEIECLLANMIFDKKLKGYISHKQRMLVVHPTDAFPSDKIVIKFPTDKIDIYQRK